MVAAGRIVCLISTKMGWSAALPAADRAGITKISVDYPVDSCARIPFGVSGIGDGARSAA